MHLPRKLTIVIVAFLNSISLSFLPHFSYTGLWFSSLNIIPLNSSAARIFWKILHGPEVQPVFFHFGILSNDQRSSTFQKMLKKKFDNLVCTHCNYVVLLYMYVLRN